ncbi:MAG: TonB-dependent receptor plug domain-containing protein [Chitinophagaceae bacterium]|nr:TonB-dependent receptor plug domain-containing protein [Chitinophagaceae bacterium]
MPLKKLHCCVFIIACLVSLLRPVAAQTGTSIPLDYASAKEKVYLHTNHVFFHPGETVYFKCYVVRGEDQTISRISPVVYTEVISPSGTVAQKLHWMVKDGFAEGSFTFDPAMPGGIYKIRAYTTWMQNEKESTWFVKELTLQQVMVPRILMKLDFPEKGYGPGSYVNASFSMRNLADEPIANKWGRFTVSLGGKEYTTQSFKTDYLGKATIQFSLPEKLETNDGLLNVKMDYNGFSEAISRSIPIVLNNVDLQFMPEGGTMVQGLSSYVAFKAVNEFGKAADVKGIVKDDKGNEVAAFDSYHFGMGKFLFTPQPGRRYLATITSPAGISKQYPLPDALSDGIVMHITKEGKDIVVRLTSTSDAEIKLKGTFRNTTYHLQKASLQKGENTIRINEAVFPMGITQFTLFTCMDLPLAERLVFTNPGKSLQVRITPDKKQYTPRQKVTLQLETLDETGQPVPANFSLSVVDDKLWTFADDKQDHILTWLLLGSELKGKIEEPQFYFKKEEAKAIPALDLLMLTQGYRYFDYTEYITRQNSLQYLPEQENVVSGRIVNKTGEPVPAEVFIVNGITGGKAAQIKTDETGSFFFSGLTPMTSYYIFAKGLEESEQVRVEVLHSGLGFNPAKARTIKPMLPSPLVYDLLVNKKPNTAPPVNEPVDAKQALALNERNRKMDDRLEGSPKQMNEVVVTALGQARQSKELGYSISKVQSNALMEAGDFRSMLSGKVAGVQVASTTNGFADTRITLRGIRTITGNSEPLLVINGVPTAFSAINSLNPADIETVTVLKDAAASAIYGSEGVNGAIIIESKKWRSENVKLSLSNKHYYASQYILLTGNNPTPVKRFYAPVYNTTETEERTDFRETIYWNGVVQTDREGKATVEYYNSDASTTFRAIAEGIGYNGTPGRNEATYAVQNAIQAEVKIPPYLTTGDKALLPLVIRNNGAAAMDMTVEVMVPVTFLVGAYNKNINVAAGSSSVVYIPLEATAAAKGMIRFSISSNAGKENINLPIEAADKGFPQVLTFSGNKPAQHDFTISKMIPGTLAARLRLIKNAEGQLLDGIESMLREPYGCFEQTSSTTYPNVFILKYLKESGKVNKEIEAKALGYIERGYQRLKGFETAQHGFEWFGHTPPHEALTAYGLMEFTDMAEFIEVDKKMMERTKQFLLSRRDGKGGFNLATGGYDKFASVPNKIANIYIVYALSKAGMGKEIPKEYAAALSKALDSKDGYLLAMMANAAHYMKDNTGYTSLMNELGRIKIKDLKAETSVVNSRDASLQVETYALYAMALLKQPAADLAKAGDLIAIILQNKSYYGYGSTQATVLALEAIVEYYRRSGRIEEDAPVTFTLNNKSISTDDMVKQTLTEGRNEFNIAYPQKNKAVPYSMEVSYSTYVPNNSNKAELKLVTSLPPAETKTGETVRFDIAVTNTVQTLQPMVVAKIGIPAGLSAQPWQLKEILEKNKAAYYEVFDNYLVFYWMGFAPGETKTISLDLKADVPGTYTAKAGTVYLYYTPEHRYWEAGKTIIINK